MSTSKANCCLAPLAVAPVHGPAVEVAVGGREVAVAVGGAVGNCLGLPSIHLATLFRENLIQHSLVNHERMGLAFQLQKVNRACANVIAHRRIGLRADQDLSLPGYR